MGNTLSDGMTFSSTCWQLNKVGTRLIDRETNMFDIEVRSQREEIRVDDSSNDEVTVPSNKKTQIPVSHSNISSYDTKLTGGSHMRTCDTEMVPQLDGPIPVCCRRRMSENARTEQESFQRPAVTHRREYPGESSNHSHSGRRTYDDRGNNCNRGYSRRGRPPDRSGGPPDNGGPPGNG